MPLQSIKSVFTAWMNIVTWTVTALLLCVCPFTSDGQSQTFTTSQTFTVPSGISTVTVQCWGGGGAGGRGGVSNKNGGGGGAGGQFASKSVSVVAGQVYQVVVGSGGAVTTTNGSAGGDSYFGANLVLAKGGAGGSAYNGTTGVAGLGSINGGIGTTVYAGGNAASGTRQSSGGGGSGAGSTGNGNTAIGTTGGAAKLSNGGAGGNGTSANSGNGLAGNNFGAGGGGATRNGIPGVGAPGLVIVSWSCSVALTSGSGTNNQQVCINSSVTPIVYSFSGVTGAGVSGLPSGVTSSYNATTNTLTLSGTPSVAGVYTYTITPTGGCTSATASGTITVNSSSVSAGPALAPICQGGSSAPLGGSVSSGATGGTWSDGGRGGVFTPSSTSLNAVYTPPAVFSGTVTLTLTANGGTCGSTTASKTLIVNPSPSSTIAYTSSSYCATVPSASVSLSGSSGGIFSSSPAGLSLNSSTGAIFPATSLAGNYQVSYTVTSAGCTANTTTSVVINPVPTVNCSPSGTITCVSSSAAIIATATASQGSSITGYLWSPSGATTSSVQVNSGAPYTVTVTQSNGCTASCTSAALVDTCRPTVGIVQSNPSCGSAGRLITAVANLCSGTGATYSWNTGATTSSITVSALGTYSVSVTQTANGCNSGASSGVSSLYAPLSASASLSNFSCTGANSTVIVSASGGTAPYAGTGSFSVSSGTYSYTVTDASGCTAVTTITVPAVVPMSAVATLTAPVACYGGSGYINVTATGGSAPYQGTGLFVRVAGTYTFTVTDALGCSAVSNSLTVAQPPILSVTATTVPTNCGTFDGSATASGAGGTPSYVYAWSNGQTGSTVNGLGAGNYTVTVTDASNCTATATGTVGINGGTTLGTTGQIVGPAGACLKSIVTFSVNPVPGATAYTWTLPLNASGASTTNSITVAFDSAYSGGSICVTPSNVCQTGNQSCINVPAILFKPAQPGPATVIGNVCGPDTLVCSVAPVANTTNYVWSVSGTVAVIVGGQGTNSVRVAIPAGFTSTQLGIQAFNCLGNSLVRLQMIVGKPVVNTALTGSNTICPNTTQNYSVGTVLGATSYSWSITGDAYISTSLNNTCSVTTNAGWTGGTLTVTATNSCGSGSRSFTLYRNMLPPGAISGPFTNLCILAGVTTADYSISPVTGALSYVWTVPQGMTIVSNTGTAITVTIDSSYVSGNVCVASVNACGQGSFRCLYTTAAPPIPTVITGPTNVCLSSSFTVYGVNSVVGAIDYNWYVTGGSTLTPYGSACVVNFTTSTAPSSTLQVNSKNECGLSQPYRITVYIDGRCRQQGDATVEQSQFTVYPNPSHGRAIVMYEAEESMRCSVTMVSVTGQLVKDEIMMMQAGSNKVEMLLDGVPAGMYFLSVTNERGVVQTVRLAVD